MGEVKIVNVGITLQLALDLSKKEATVIACAATMGDIEKRKPEDITTKHVIKESESRYGLIHVGALTEVGGMLPLNTMIRIFINGEEFYSSRPIKTSRGVRARITGLTQLYKDYQKELEVGNTIFLSYNPKTRVLSINTDSREQKE